MIPLYKPRMPEDLSELNKILYSGALAYGEYGKAFEKAMSTHLGVDQLVSINSFNSAILVTLLTLGIQSGDEIIASPVACLASNQPFVTIGAKVIWADIDPKTGTLDPESVKGKITSKTKAIFHNHFCGFPGHIDEINSLGIGFGIPVVDDAIEGYGSEYKGKKLGNTGTDVTVFSFQAVRMPTTIDGGAIVFKDKGLFEKSIMVRDSGIDRRFFRDEMGEINRKYDIEIPEFSATMSEINSYIGIQQMHDIDKLLEIQRSNARGWNDKIQEHYPSFEIFSQRVETNPNFCVYGVLVDRKQEVMTAFRNDGYYASSVHLPNNFYSIFGPKKSFAGVSEFYSRFLALPCGWWL